MIPFLVAVALDDHLAIRFPVALPDDRCFAWLALAFLDYGRSFAISIAVIRAYRHSGSDRADSDTNTGSRFDVRYRVDHRKWKLWKKDTRNLVINIPAPVELALLYWAGRDHPCTPDAETGVCGIPKESEEPYRDQVILLEYDQTDRFSWILSRNEDRTYALDVRVRHVF